MNDANQNLIRPGYETQPTAGFPHALVLRACRRLQAGEQAALRQRSLGEQGIEMLDAAFGMKMLIERIVQVSSVHRGVAIARADLLQRTHHLPVFFSQ